METAQQAAILNQRIQDVLAEISSGISTESNDTRAIELMRLRSIVDYIFSRVAGADLDLALPGTVSNIDGGLNTAMGELQSYLSNRNVGHLTNTLSYLQNVQRYAAELPLPSGALGDGYPALAVESLRSSAEQGIASVAGSRDAVVRDYEQLKTKAETLSRLVEQQTSRVDDALAEQQRLFQKSQEDRLTNNAAAMADLAEKAQVIRDDLAATGKQTIETMEAMREQAQTLLHIIGNTGMAGEYAKTANDSRRLAARWQLVAAFSLSALVLFAILAYLALGSGTADMSHVLGRVFVAATFGVLAAYASRLADHERRIEERNRRYALVLSSIDPYLADIEPEQRKEVKIELAKNLFSQPSSEASSATDAAFDGNAKDFIQLLIQLANTFKGGK